MTSNSMILSHFYHSSKKLDTGTAPSHTPSYPPVLSSGPFQSRAVLDAVLHMLVCVKVEGGLIVEVE